jgi:HEAT repeat protein
MLTRDPDRRAGISALLNDDDFPILVAAASDDDKTVRLQAAEFLYLLGDQRSIPYSVDAARDTHDNNKASNQISILGQSAKQLSPPEKNKVLQDLQSGPGPNNDLVGREGWIRRQLGIDF